MAAPVGPKKVKRYSDEFKIQAVKLSLHPEIQTQDVAHALDIHRFMLSKWKKDYREGKLKRAAHAARLSLPEVLRSPVLDPEKREPKRQVEHDLLKKVIRFNIERRRRNASGVSRPHVALRRGGTGLHSLEVLEPTLDSGRVSGGPHWSRRDRDAAFSSGRTCPGEDRGDSPR